MKISGRTIFIGLATLLIMGTSVAYYFFINKEPQNLEWEASSWLYRKTLAIPNKGSMVINKTVFINLDTKSLITANKLQPNCEDLRFLDNDESTTLQHWIEGECNTVSTKILVKIPSLPKEGKNIYVLYGNPAALDTQEKLTLDN